MRLTKNFTLEEFTRSDTARELGVLNSPNPVERIRISQLAFALQWLRAGVYDDKPFIITSGFRDENVNAAVGGTRTSHHRLGWAVDFYVLGVDIEQAARDIRDFIIATDMPFDQMIYEPSRGIIHLSISPEKGYRRQFLTQKGGPGTPIVEGIMT